MTMTTEIARPNGSGQVSAPARTGSIVTDEHRDILRQMVDRNASPAQVEMLILVGNRYNLDPLLSHLVLITGKVFVTHKGLMHTAHASKQLDGMKTTYGRDEMGDWCECTIFRKDMTHPWTERIYIAEYKNNNPVWKQFPRAMAAKTAESFTLRRAFDVALTSQEEMGVDNTLPEHSERLIPQEGQQAREQVAPARAGEQLAARQTVPAREPLRPAAQAKPATADTVPGTIQERRTHLRRLMQSMSEADMQATLEAFTDVFGRNDYGAFDLDQCRRAIAAIETGAWPDETPGSGETDPFDDANAFKNQQRALMEADVQQKGHGDS